ncbi:hypothetical protein Tco_0737520 [Tanacetum coccineum]
MHGNSAEMPYDVFKTQGNGETRGNAGEMSPRKGETFLKLWYADPYRGNVRGNVSGPKTHVSYGPLTKILYFGAKTPLLRSLAFKVLDQPTSSSCCERNWSTYSFIHSLRRNKLSPKRAEDLVFIHNNLRLLSRSTDQYNEEKTMMWDVGGDDFGTLEDTTFLEFVSLSLDKPELERVFFSEDTITT